MSRQDGAMINRRIVHPDHMTCMVHRKGCKRDGSQPSNRELI